VPKIIISLFAVLNIGTVLYMNRPEQLIAATESAVRRHLDQWSGYQIKRADWLVRRYANVVGLDNRWEFFGRVSRFNWHYLVQARTADGRMSVLPLPRQSPRTFVQRTFVDFKEAKFHLNLYGRERSREAYARHLCRAYPTVQGAPVSSVVFEIYTQNILPMGAAARRGMTLEPDLHKWPGDEFPCR
jgi:hypothetical protein